MAGYSGTPLARKLGIRPGHRVRLRNAPGGLDDSLAPLPEVVEIARSGEGAFPAQIVFLKGRSALETRLGDAIESMPADGMVWLAWPKKSSGVETDLTREVIREVGLAAGLVDVKVCAIDEVWSGLKFVVRTDDRADWPNPSAGGCGPSPLDFVPTDFYVEALGFEVGDGGRGDASVLFLYERGSARWILGRFAVDAVEHRHPADSQVAFRLPERRADEMIPMRPEANRIQSRDGDPSLGDAADGSGTTDGSCRVLDGLTYADTRTIL